jgi:predicted neuraminidase
LEGISNEYQPPQIISTPSKDYSPEKRKIQLVPGLVVTPGGRLWATWYAGETAAEDRNNYVILATSGDAGKTWREVLVVDPDKDGPLRTFDSNVWLAPNGRLWLFWAQALVENTDKRDGARATTWYLEIDNPENQTPHYRKPTLATTGIMLNKPTVLTTGEWVLPVSIWHHDYSARMVVSTDGGKTWHVRGACNVPEWVRDFDEHMIVERNDGSLWMMIRTRDGLAESFSRDQGRNWSPAHRSKVQHPHSRFFVSRLESGRVLLVKHGKTIDHVDDQLEYAHKYWRGRSHLSAWVSDDEGKTWKGGLILDERPDVSYPDGMQTEDGTIHIIYDHKRRMRQDILMARFTEQDVLAGKIISKRGKLRIKVR